MARLILLDPYYSDRATLSGGDWAMPLSYLQDMQPTRSVQSAGVTTAATQFDVDFGSAVTCDYIAMGRVRAPADATVTVKAATSQGGLASPTWSSGSMSVWPSSGKPGDRGLIFYDVLKALAAGSAYRWWRIEIDGQNSGDGYLELGRLYMGPKWQPAYNFSYGWRNSREPLDLRIEAKSGHTLTGARKKPRLWDLPINTVAKDDAEDAIYEFRRNFGTHGDFFLCLDPDATTRLHRKMMMATFSAIPEDAQPYHNTFSAAFKVRELL